jgi:hypothetical protein
MERLESILRQVVGENVEAINTHSTLGPRKRMYVGMLQNGGTAAGNAGEGG